MLAPVILERQLGRISRSGSICRSITRCYFSRTGDKLRAGVKWLGAWWIVCPIRMGLALSALIAVQGRINDT